MKGVRPGRAAADTVLAVAILASGWKLASVAVGLEIILPPPEKVLYTLYDVSLSPAFARALVATSLRGLAAFAISMAAGILVGLVNGVSVRATTLSAPALTVIRATPVLAIILLALIWFPSGVVPVFSAVVMAFPVVVADVATGIRSADPSLVGMARSFGMDRLAIVRHVRMPSALPYVMSAARNAMGLSWKVVVAGEVLSQPTHAVGTGMQNARLMLETTEVFAWAAVGVLLCALSDAAFSLLERKLQWSAN